MRELFLNVIKEMALAPETQIDRHLAINCDKFFKKANSLSDEEIITFLRNLLDECVYTGSSEFCVKILSHLLKMVPDETVIERASRHADLEKHRNSAV